MPMNFKLEIAWYKLIKNLAVGQSVALFSNQAQHIHCTLKILIVHQMYLKSHSHVITQIALLEKKIPELIKSETTIVECEKYVMNKNQQRFC